MLRTFEAGPLDVNCYILSCDSTKETAIIDPGGAAKNIFKYIETHRLVPKFVINTHGHYDHIGGDMAFKEKYNIPVYVHKNDEDMLINIKDYVPFVGMLLPDMPKPDGYLTDGQIIKLGDLTLKVLHTPGHTRGGVSIYVKEIGAVFSGDTLFCENVGRTDLPYSSTDQIIKSIREKLFALDDKTVVYPGHGRETTIGHEKQENEFV